MRKNTLAAVLTMAALLALVGCNGNGIVITPPRPTKIVKVCADTGLLANEFCPTPVDRKFYSEPKPGEPAAPTALCAVHKKPLTDPVPPFAGAADYQLIGYPEAKITAFLEANHAAGGDITETFGIFSWWDIYPTGGWHWSPCVQVGTYTDNGATYPLFDLGRRNDAVMEKWRFIASECKRLETALVFNLEDFCSIKTASNKRHYLFRANTWRLSGATPPESATSSGQYNWPAGFQEGFEKSGYMQAVKQILGWYLEVFKSTGVELYLVPMNEADVLANSAELEHPENLDASVAAYHDWVIKWAGEMGVSEDHIIICTSRALATIRARHPKAKIDLHGCNSPDRMEQRKAAFGDPAAILFSGDGPDPYATGIAGDSLSKRQPSIEQGKYMGDRLRAWGAFAVIFFTRESERIVRESNLALPPDIGLVSEAFAVVRAIVGK